MATHEHVHSWFGPTLLDDRSEPPEELQEYQRLWRGFMTARAVVALVLFLTQGVFYLLVQSSNLPLVLLAGGFFVLTLLTRLLLRPRRLGRAFDRYWLASIGVDVVIFSVLQWLHGSVINYTPLYTLPILMAAVLGSLRMAMGTAAGVTLLLLAHGGRQAILGAGDGTPYFVQAALPGAGGFVIAFLAHQLAARLAREQQRARHSQLAVRMQQQVNELVIESMSDGVLVVDVRGNVHAANPAARQMLQADGHPLKASSFNLARDAAWRPLSELAFQAFSGRGDFHHADVDIQHPGQGTRRLRVRVRMTTDRWGEAELLCVMFLQDQREMEARMRTEKLASMGRMSAAVAHEIRNPLAAIAQANALLEEDLEDAKLKRLTQMIGQNAMRLGKIVDDVLDVSRVGARASGLEPHALSLNETAGRICRDWAQQTGGAAMLALRLTPEAVVVNFDPEHLRRVLVNLLDNAYRHASRQQESILVMTHVDNAGGATLSVWSDGPPMEPSVEKHLFEPFFSSESRSSGLGLYICRELCDRHGATITYRRTPRPARDTLMEGNEFTITLRRPRLKGGAHSATAQPTAP